MKNFLFDKINWKNIEYIGFDMDGTLYDEFEFIEQVYSEISKQFKNKSAKEYMLKRWLEKGSSYNRIFDETYDLFKKDLICNISKENFIKNCLNIFRNFNPKIKISKRTKNILKYFSQKYKLFLVSDGNLNLQKKKFKSLKLDWYFNEKNVFFTGIDAQRYSKPNITCLNQLKVIPEKSVFFGDREVDELFAKKSKMQFQKVYNMLKVY